MTARGMEVLALLLVVAVVRGEEDLAALSWTPVTNSASLESALSCTSCILDLRITNGTEWLQIGGELNTFLPIVTGESQVAATSDLSLASALAAFRDRRAPGRSGLHISFLTTSIIPASITAIAAAFPEPALPFPLMVSADVVDASSGRSPLHLTDGPAFLSSLADQVPGASPVLGWTTYHGLDPVWSRIAGEGILKEFQRARLEGLVDRLWREPTRLHEQEVRFAELLDQKLERKQGSTFTAWRWGSWWPPSRPTATTSSRCPPGRLASPTGLLGGSQ